jgi:SAM-dependent methyltransferase
MGYRHAFDTLTIVDVPPHQSLEQSHAHECYDVVETPSGTIRYCYRSMGEIEQVGLMDNSIDLFWMGQSIEHISEGECDVVLRAIRRYLKPGGFFCFDTPNRAVTRLQSPNGFIHPDHKVEYEFADLTRKLDAAGFEIVEVAGIGLAEESCRRGRFMTQELIEQMSTNSDPEHSYVLYFKARTPNA